MDTNTLLYLTLPLCTALISAMVYLWWFVGKDARRCQAIMRGEHQ